MKLRWLLPLFGFLLLAPFAKADEPVLPTVYLNVVNGTAYVTAQNFETLPTEWWICRWDEDGNELPCSTESVTWVDGQVELASAIFYFGGRVGEYSLSENAIEAGWFKTQNAEGLDDGVKRARLIEPEPEVIHFDVVNGTAYVTAQNFETLPTEWWICRWDEDGNELPCSTESVTWVDGQVELASAIFYFGGRVGEYSLSENAIEAGWFKTQNAEGLDDGVKRSKPDIPNPEPVFNLFVPIVTR